MTLPGPVLDDRSYQQLRDELVQRIPVYTPEWTDHNASDPGVTLLELFAFLGETLLWRFNQIPDATHIAFLRLLDIPLRPALPAKVLLAFTTEQPAGVGADIGAEAKAGDLPFETLDEVTVWPLTATGHARVRAAAPQQATEPEVYERALRSVSALAASQALPADAEPDYYALQALPTVEGGLAADLPNAVDKTLWVALHRGRGFAADALANGVLNLAFVPELSAPPIEDCVACDGVPSSAARAPAVEWQVSLVAPRNGDADWQRITVVGDTTDGLTREGVVRLRLPRDLAPVGPPALDDPALAGTGQRPPPLDDETEARLFCWLRAWRVDGSDLPRAVLLVANAAQARQSARARPEFLGTGSGQPGQVLRLVKAPVLAGSAEIEVEEVDGWKAWSEVDGFHASGPDDRHYRLDAATGEIRFGNGEQGRAPQIGERVRAASYRHGGGAAGNVAKNTVTKTALGRVKVDNPLRAAGGSDAEPLEQALDRIPGELRRRDRAVTADDFRELALQVAGVARAECLPRFHAPTLTPERPGIVTVVVWPADDPVQPEAPRPDRRLLAAVCAFLDARRLVTTELYVVPPTYRKVSVSVGLQVKPGYGVEAVRRWVELVLRQYLAPLPPYGPAGQGWPLGRRVHGPELEAAALQVEGVEFLEGLRVAGRNDDDTGWIEGSVELDAHEVPWLTEVAVVEGAAPDPALALVPPAPGTPVPVPVEREQC